MEVVDGLLLVLVFKLVALGERLTVCCYIFNVLFLKIGVNG